uniref:Uncharacterized protein n=1 Tax=Panagrolaimus sp. JU765 TaxID=591449 RepID=A0AC34QCC9_9BILA
MKWTIILLVLSFSFALVVTEKSEENSEENVDKATSPTIIASTVKPTEDDLLKDLEKIGVSLYNKIIIGFISFIDHFSHLVMDSKNVTDIDDNTNTTTVASVPTRRLRTIATLPTRRLRTMVPRPTSTSKKPENIENDGDVTESTL